MDELQKFENWINENCYMNGGRLQVYGTIRRDVATYYKENQAKNNEVLDPVSDTLQNCTYCCRGVFVNKKCNYCGADKLM